MTRPPTFSTHGIPALGFGTSGNYDPDQCTSSVSTALDIGYRFIDTAETYGTEAAIGRAIARSSVDREDLFVATKVWIENLGYDNVLSAARGSLDQLGLDTLDILYVHWPTGQYDPAETLPAFDHLYEEGLIQRIGVSNFDRAHLARAVDVLENPIAANQVECHPFLPQRDLRAAAREFGHDLVGYAPLTKTRYFDHPVIQAVAESEGATPAQVCLAWLREKEVIAIPKATSRAHIEENWASLAVELSEPSVDRLDGIEPHDRLVDPPWSPW